MTSAATTAPLSGNVKEKRPAKEPLKFTFKEILWPTAFLLSLSMIGLHIPVGFLFVPLILLQRFINDRYDFVIMLTFLVGGYAFIEGPDLYIDLMLLTTLVWVLACLVLKKPPILMKVFVAICIFCALQLLIMSRSLESMRIQWPGLRDSLTIGYLFVPFVVFSGKKFDIMVFFKHVIAYVLVICVFYIIDSAIVGGEVLIPRDPSFYHSGLVSMIGNLHYGDFLVRRWPLALKILVLAVYPIAKYYKLSPLQWVLIISALLICRTFTFAAGVVVGYVVLKGKGTKLLKYAGIGIAAIVALYFIDASLGETVIESEYHEDEVSVTSTLRIKSQIDQILFFDATKADDTDLAKLGTNRGAQIIPKLMLLYELGKEWTGLGYLSRENTKISAYTIDNFMYFDVDNSIEVATGVECDPIQILLTIGYFGLILYVAFYYYLWRVIRKLPYAGLYLSTLGIFCLIGIAGAGILSHSSLILVALGYAAVILNSKDRLEWYGKAKRALGRNLK